jgi:Mg2+-importing ATPase
MIQDQFWQKTPSEILKQLGSVESGLSSKKAAQKQRELQKKKSQLPEWLQTLRLFVRQFTSPLVLLLVFAAVLSASMGDWSNSIILISILFLTGSISFYQEYRAGKAVQKLRAMMHIHCTVLRDGAPKKVPKEFIVPGDIVLLSAGDVVPGDCLLLEETDLHTNESALTGESFPVEKEPGVSPADAPISARKNALFEGSSVISGTGRVIVVQTGADTEFGKIAAQMAEAEPETSFQSGIRKFGYLLLRMTFILSAGILIFNLFLGKPIAASILFSIALAVGLAPELLPAIMVTTLSAGAIRMARDKVIVKRLDAIQNLGAINMLCSDKTGTLTTGAASVARTLGFDGENNDRVKLFAWLNANFETGFANPLDDAIRKITGMDAGSYSKKDEVPYDFLRKRLSVVVHDGAKELMITKGALSEVLSVCNRVEMPDGSLVNIETVRKVVMQQFETQSEQGYRTIGIAWKDVTGDPIINQDDEIEMIFLGFLLLEDPPRSDIADTLQSLEDLGITLKIITGDNHLAAAHLARTIGIDAKKLLTGHDISILSDAALARKVQSVNLYAEVEPQQKERIIRALRANGHVVGYLGDGINDAPALKAADVGISVDSAVDVAKEAADIVLMEKNLEVLKKGILDGRRTYVNTLKYIFITTSANFGNMFSLAGISLFLPWLPLLPAQILMLNFLSDVPALTIASDNVDEEQLRRPKHWDIALIRRFMVVFGIQSSLFDYLTFGCLLLIFKATEKTFQTGWFIESVLTEIMVLLIIRTVRPALKSRPSRWLLGASIATVAVTLLLPYLPLGEKVGLAPLPLPMLGFMIAIAILYSFIVESTKRRFFRKAAL